MFASRMPAAAARRLGSLPARQAARLFRRLRVDRSGNVAMLFSLMLIPLVAMIGLAVDFGHVYKVTSHTQAALDSAALAAGRAAQLNSGTAATAASAAASAYFNQAKPTGCGHQHAGIHYERRQHGIHGHGDLVGENAVPERALLGRSQGGRRRRPDRLPIERLWLRDGDEHGNLGAVPERSLHGYLLGRHQRRDVPDARRDGLDVSALHEDRRRKVRRQGPDRHRGVGRPEQVLLQGGAGAVRRGRERGHNAGAPGARHGHLRALRHSPPAT